MLLKHSLCFRGRLSEFEAEFDADPLLLHIFILAGLYDRKRALTRH